MLSLDMNKLLPQAGPHAKLTLNPLKIDQLNISPLPSPLVPETINTNFPVCLNQQTGKNFSVMHGDCCELVKSLPGESIHFTVYSPPFASLYVYSNSERDMGNAKDYDEFRRHYSFLVRELLRVTKPGRLCSVHCMNLPTSISHHGYIGIQDFRGDIVREHVEAGWIFHSEVCIWKDPVTAMQRTKALGLLHKQVVKDSCMSRQGIPDYVVTFRKPGKNPEPVEGEFDRWIGDESFKSAGQDQYKKDLEDYQEYLSLTHSQRLEWIDCGGRTEPPERKASEAKAGSRLSIDVWQRFASPVWMDINATRTLQYMQARHEDDERHIAPLQLDVIERCLELWSNEGDVILSPFTGIGSEGYVSLTRGRKFIGFELKETYFNAACKNLRVAESEYRNISRNLFSQSESGQDKKE